MPDRENVIKTIVGCINDDSFCNKCDYDGCVFQHGSCEKDLLADALALLKDQEAKEVKESTNMYTGLPITHCPKCGISLDRFLYGRQHEGQINNCPYCGQAVKWE